MKIPLRAAVVSLLTNTVLSIVLMNLFGVIGLAWANLISSLCQVMILAPSLSFLRFSSWLNSEKVSLNLSVPASFLMAVFVYSMDALLADYSSKLLTTLSVALIIVTASGLYLLTLRILKFPEFQNLLEERHHGRD
jgi:peptidoglycan biosynthesis protein MviN/MurJ (putative lipid II flippase)